MAVLFGLSPGASGRAFAYSDDPFFSCLVVSFDDALAAQLASAHLGADRMELNAYDYSAAEAVIMNDQGFVPSIRMLPSGPRRTVVREGNVVVERNVALAEIKEVHRLAKQALDESYEGLFQPEIRRAVATVEDALDPAFVNFGVVRDLDTSKVIGVVRIARAYARGGKIRLPALDILRSRGLLSDSDESALLSRFGYRRNSAGWEGLTLGAFEVGQFYLDSSLTARRRDMVRDHLLLWMAARNIESTRDESLALVHTSRAAHDRLWKNQYGIEELVLEKTGSDRITERVRSTSAGALMTLLRGRLHLP